MNIMQKHKSACPILKFSLEILFISSLVTSFCPKLARQRRSNPRVMDVHSASVEVTEILKSIGHDVGIITNDN